MCQLGQRQLALGRNKCGQKGEVVAFPRRLQPPVSSSAGLQRSFLGHPLRPALVPSAISFPLLSRGSAGQRAHSFLSWRCHVSSCFNGTLFVAIVVVWIKDSPRSEVTLESLVVVDSAGHWPSWDVICSKGSKHVQATPLPNINEHQTLTTQKERGQIGYTFEMQRMFGAAASPLFSRGWIAFGALHVRPVFGCYWRRSCLGTIVGLDAWVSGEDDIDSVKGRLDRGVGESISEQLKSDW